MRKSKNTDCGGKTASLRPQERKRKLFAASKISKCKLTQDYRLGSENNDKCNTLLHHTRFQNILIHISSFPRKPRVSAGKQKVR